MPRARIVCMGWVDSATGEQHPPGRARGRLCGKVLGFTETPTGGDSHGLCLDCFRAQMTSEGYRQEQIDQMLRDAGYIE